MSAELMIDLIYKQGQQIEIKKETEEEGIASVFLFVIINNVRYFSSITKRKEKNYFSLSLLFFRRCGCVYLLKRG